MFKIPCAVTPPTEGYTRTIICCIIYFSKAQNPKNYGISAINKNRPIKEGTVNKSRFIDD